MQDPDQSAQGAYSDMLVAECPSATSHMGSLCSRLRNYPDSWCFPARWSSHWLSGNFGLPQRNSSTDRGQRNRG